MTKRILKEDQSLHCFVAIVAHMDTQREDVSKDHVEIVLQDRKKDHFTVT